MQDKVVAVGRAAALIRENDESFRDAGKALFLDLGDDYMDVCFGINH